LLELFDKSGLRKIGRKEQDRFASSRPLDAIVI
jgi:hypothetical protein